MRTCMREYSLRQRGKAPPHAEARTHRTHERLKFRGVDLLVTVEVVLLEHQGRLDGTPVARGVTLRRLAPLCGIIHLLYSR
jgi:hypothetical protein